MQNYKIVLLIAALITANLIPNVSADQRPFLVDSSIDSLVENVIKEFNVPGVAIGILKDGKIIHNKGYGFANLKTNRATNENTIFKIASNSKAFTTVALAILVDRGKLNWNDKIIEHLPDFKMYDPWVTKEFNVIDLLTHRSGLRIGAGDLMLWPEPTNFTRKQIVHNLRYLKPIGSFRNEYAYDNLLYIVAGELIAKISGQSWEDFIQSNIFAPLQMKDCFAGGINTKINANLAAPHSIINDKVAVQTANLINHKASLMAAAGGIKCSVNDLLKWIDVQLNEGQMKNGKQLFSKQQSEMMWKPVVTLPLSRLSKALDNSHYRAYALGWRISDYHGLLRISHTGTLSGMMSQIILLPDLNFGLIILTNQQSGDARNVLARSLLQFFVPPKSKSIDWLEYYKNQSSNDHLNSAANSSHEQSKLLENKELENKELENKELAINFKQNNLQKIGRYVDNWFGEINLIKVGNKLIFKSKKSPRMVGELFYHSPNQWWVKWDDRSFEADAWLFFSKNKSGKLELKMKAISENADWSFDFEDLAFTKI